VSKLTADEIETGVFLIYSFFWREMQAQLVQLGVSSERICSFFLPDRTLDEQFEMAETGADMCAKFRKEAGNLPIFLCPYTGTGDIYLIGTFWNEYLESKKMDDYIFVVISKACEMVTNIFGFHNVKRIKQVESSYLVEYYKLCNEEAGIIILNDSWWELRANPLQRFRGYKGLYFTEIFRKFVFDLPDTSKPVQPKLKDVSDVTGRIFTEAGLVPGKTVVLSPYSNTLSDLTLEFWKKLAEELKASGYCVCTNCGSDDEKEIEGTIRLFAALDLAPQVIEKAGYFVGVRSGFCDCISAAKAKLVVLYDKRNRFFNCSAYEYFSLNHMGLRDDAVEIEYERLEDKKLLCEVLDAIGG
jgi:hypothetical protein